MQAAANARPDFLTTLASLMNANDDTLTHMVILHAEGTIPGDAAFAALAARHGIRGAHAAVEAERDARSLDIWAQRMEAIAAEALAA